MVVVIGMEVGGGGFGGGEWSVQRKREAEQSS